MGNSGSAALIRVIGAAWSLFASFSLLDAGPASAQSSVAAQCSGASGKALTCCQKIVTANPSIGQCEKEVAVFRCVGIRNNKYVSRSGCVMPQR